MNKYNGKKFIASYSGGKDSVLSIYRAKKLGMIPMGLITTINIDRGLSWFHSIPLSVLDEISDSIKIPITLIKTKAEDYVDNFEKTLKTAKDNGAELCVFGDIDIEGHIKWCTDRCNNVGLDVFFPLLNENRRNLVTEFINLDFETHLTVVDTTRLSESFLGKKLTLDLANEIESLGADICGENGEYHTFVSDGPLFSYPLDIVFDDVVKFEKYAILPIKER